MKLNKYVLEGYNNFPSQYFVRVIVVAGSRDEAFDKAMRLMNLEYFIVEIDSTFDSNSIIIDDLTKEEAKDKIIKYFELHSPNVVYPSDILEYLKIDFELGMDIIDELKRESKIEILNK